MDTLVLDVIVKYNETRAGGANFLHLESKFPEMDYDEISSILERLIEEGAIVRENYLYYPKNH